MDKTFRPLGLGRRVTSVEFIVCCVPLKSQQDSKESTSQITPTNPVLSTSNYKYLDCVYVST